MYCGCSGKKKALYNFYSFLKGCNPEDKPVDGKELRIVHDQKGMKDNQMRYIYFLTFQ